MSRLLHRNPDSSLRLPWKPLYDLLSTIYFRSGRDSKYRGQAVEAYHLAGLRRLILQARKYVFVALPASPCLR